MSTSVASDFNTSRPSLSKLLRALIDPNFAPGALVRDERKLMIVASHSHILAFDNLSDLLVRSRMRFAAARAAVASRYDSSTPMMWRYSFTLNGHPLEQHHPSAGPSRSGTLSDIACDRRGARETSGASSRPHGRGSWVPCSTRWHMAWVSCLTSASRDCRGRPILGSEQRHAKTAF
jgi:hypothetical protein